MADINHEIKIHAAPARVFQALTSLSDLTKWHTAKIEGDAAAGKDFRVLPQGEPAFEWKVLKAEAGKQVVWKCVDGPGHSAGTTATFSLTPEQDGRTLVEFAHSGWPDAVGNFRKCNTLWAILLYHLKNYLETQKADPAYS